MDEIREDEGTKLEDKQLEDVVGGRILIELPEDTGQQPSAQGGSSSGSSNG